MDQERLRGILGIVGVLGGLGAFFAGLKVSIEWLPLAGLALFFIGFRLIRGATGRSRGDYSVYGGSDGGFGGGHSDGGGGSGGDGD